MIYRVEFTEAARNAVIHLPPAVKQEIKEGIRFLAAAPLGGEPLKRELQGKRKFRIGKYRLIYQLELHRKVVLIIAVGHRRTIYEELTRTAHI